MFAIMDFRCAIIIQEILVLFLQNWKDYLLSGLVFYINFKVMELINWNDFEKVELRAGTILDVQPFPKARKLAYKLSIDFGPFGILKSSAQITRHYTPENLIGRQILAVINFPEKQIADFWSQCLVTGFADENGDIVLTALDMKVPDGTKIA